MTFLVLSHKRILLSDHLHRDQSVHTTGVKDLKNLQDVKNVVRSTATNPDRSRQKLLAGFHVVLEAHDYDARRENVIGGMKSGVMGSESRTRSSTKRVVGQKKRKKGA